MTLRFSCLTLFPESFEPLRVDGVFARALARGLVSLETVFLRELLARIDSNPHRWLPMNYNSNGRAP